MFESFCREKSFQKTNIIDLLEKSNWRMSTEWVSEWTIGILESNLIDKYIVEM